MIRDKCGTYAGVQQHQVHKEPLCDPCRYAKAKYMREYRAQHPESVKRQTKDTAIRMKAMRVLAQRHLLEFRQIYTQIKKEQ